MTALNSHRSRIELVWSTEVLVLLIIVGTVLSGCTGRAGGVSIWNAIESNDIPAIAKYIEASGDINVATGNGVTPLIHAFDKGQFEAFEYLLQNGANPNVCDRDGAALMVDVATVKDPRWLKVALDHGGNPDSFL